MQFSAYDAVSYGETDGKKQISHSSPRTASGCNADVADLVNRLCN
jgi:hypothetical protein